MNNKGFAITTILYGVLILFLMLLVSMLGILAAYKDRLEILIEGNNGARCIINGNCSVEDDNFTYLYDVANAGEFVDYGGALWFVLYKEDNFVYIVSSTVLINEVNFDLIEAIPDEFKNKISEYCNTDYVAGGVCSYPSTMLTLNDSSFRKFTLQYYGAERSLFSCYQKSDDIGCGFDDYIIDINNSYWFDSNFNGQQIYYYWDGVNKYINSAGEGNKYGVRPVIKLDTSILAKSGDGSYEHPYLISTRSS